MKDSKTILKRHLILSLTLQALIVTLIALPPLEVYRAKIAEIIQLPAGVFWIPFLALLLAGNAIVFRRLNKRLVHPLQELVHQTKLGAASIAFKKKSMNTEEDNLKHFIESQALRSTDLEQEVTRMEGEVERISELAAISPEEIDKLHAKLKAAAEETETYANQFKSEQKLAESLEKQIAELKKELKQRNREIETLHEDAREQSAEYRGAPLSSILVEKLKTPLSLINNLSWRLAKSWADTPPAQIREGLEEISKQSEEQLELLKKYHVEDDSQTSRDAL
ncbi:hypothetical protein VDG1235_3999 [Verrucomicrobiia bacterium DG1235]|nr:hypothetical protein VDG1235_3999 [Verrucomicrobiae bacterium DG1235]